MMDDVVFIGDAVTGAGFRLVGIASHSPAPEALDAAVAEAMDTARLVLMTPESFAALPEGRARALEAADRPLLVIVPDLQGRAPVPDIERDVRRALGIEV